MNSIKLLKMDTDPLLLTEQPIQPIEEQSEIPEKQFETLIERNKSIIADFTKGVPAESIALKHNISKPQVYNIVRNNPTILSTNRELEKIRRIRRLRLCENKAPKNLAPKNVTELVNVLDAQRKELEPDTNTINIDNRTLTVSTEIDPELIASIKSINDMFSKLLADTKTSGLIEQKDSSNSTP